ncbi:MAG: hypothetical protein HOG49_18255 [Candidatus Scalindua sp.]|nr:hypothetical protein [Candidatus Scalindua sp.]
MIKELRSQIDQEKGKRDEVKRTLLELDNNRKVLKKSIRRSEEAQAIIQKVAKDTQSQLEIHISDIVTMALETIFDDPYEFKIEFVVKRNKTECELLFEKDGEKINPLTASGGGVIDTVSFALRIALWTLQNPRSRNTIILDEPFKFLSKDLLPRASELLKELSKKLNLQFIIVTHLDELTDCADKTFDVKIKKGASHVKES